VTQASTSTRRPLLKAGEVCELAKVQPYVLRSWEKEFPNLGVSKTPEGPRFYRKSDLDEVLRIKQLVYGEGLTIAGARRKLEEEREKPPEGLPFDDEDVTDTKKKGGTVPALVRRRLEGIRTGLRSILELLERPATRTAGNGRAGRDAARTVVAASASARVPPPAARAKSRGTGAAARR
jgi:DNA-binding transcriptional MerR regulator